MKKNQLHRKFFKLRKHAEKGQYILKSCEKSFASNLDSILIWVQKEVPFGNVQQRAQK